MNRILLLSPEPFGACLAGPAIRFLEIAGALQRAGHTVTLCGTGADAPAGEVRPQTAPHGAALRELVEAHDFIITSGDILTPALRRAAGRRPVIHDMIIPAYFESLMNNRLPDGNADRLAAARRRHLAIHHRAMRRRLLRQLPLADHFLCGSERQRDMLLGWLAAAGAVAHERGNEMLPVEHLVSIVPHGIPAAALPGTGDKTLFPGCTAADTIFLWWGCACDWYDLDTLCHAMAALAARRPDIKLVLGARQVPGQAAGKNPLAGLCDRADHRALFWRTIITLEHWIPYAERGAYLAAADAGVYAHQPTLESHFAVRTRFFDYLWAGLPVIISEGDCFSTTVRDSGFGLVVPPGDSNAWAAAMEKIADDRELRSACRDRIIARQAEYTWDAAVKPLTRALAFLPGRAALPRARPGTYAAHLLARAKSTLQTGGATALARKTSRHIRKLLS